MGLFTTPSKNIEFNYLLNGAFLNGMEQTRSGQKKIRGLLNFLDRAGVDSVTVASPYLLRLIKKQYPGFKVRVSVFSLVNTVEKAKRWRDMGADTICLSGISLNRNFKMLSNIRKAVDCDLQLIPNASCLPDCVYELAHMNMLTLSSRIKDKTGGFCLDYCFLQCSQKRLEEPVNYIRSIWIRPEDLYIYEDMGYNDFKLVERSSPTGLLLKRVKAYSERSFHGNLLELVAPVAHIKKEQNASFFQRAKVILSMLKPFKVKIGSLYLMKKYVDNVIMHDFAKETSPIYIENKNLENFMTEIIKRDCDLSKCDKCGYCWKIAEKEVHINDDYRNETLSMARKLEEGLHDSGHWL